MSGQIGRSPRSVVPNLSVVTSLTQYRYWIGMGSSRCLRSRMSSIVRKSTPGVASMKPVGLTATETNVNVRKLTAMRTGMLYSRRRRTNAKI
jgi:hypothetical protein